MSENIYLLNRRPAGGQGLLTPDEFESVRAFFESHVQAPPTPLHRLRGLAGEIGIREILLKDESTRLGMNAFKIVGVTYALHRLQAAGRISAGARLVCASAGNHGRAVARIAAQNRLHARVYVGRSTSSARIEAIRGEGAEVVVVEGSYDDAVATAVQEAKSTGAILFSDTAVVASDPIPRLIMAGYTWIMEEARRQWTLIGRRPDAVVVQAGVGGLACAVASWVAHHYPDSPPRVIVVEPRASACVLEAARADRVVRLPGSLDTIMTGLRCGEISHSVLAPLLQTVDAFITISDLQCREAVRRLVRATGSDPQIHGGPSGVAGIAAIGVLYHDLVFQGVPEALGLGPGSSFLAILTEGVTDPGAFRSIIDNEESS